MERDGGWRRGDRVERDGGWRRGDRVEEGRGMGDGVVGWRKGGG